MKAFGLSLDGEIENTRESKMRHARVGALFGLVAGLAFAVSAAGVDLLTHRDLPLGFEFDFLLSYGLAVSAVLSIVGFMTCWAVETWRGLAYGALATSSIVLAGSLLQPSEATTGMKIIALAFTLVPVAALALPISWTLRWLTERYARARYVRFSALKIALLVAVTLTLGAAGGWFMRMPPRAVEAVHFMNGLIRIAPNHEDNALRRVAGFEDHLSAGYHLYEKPSTGSTEGFVVTAEYEDGYQLSCTVVVFPGSDPFLSSCNDDKNENP
ncbi:MAG: hypothetical protein IPM31_11195 [Anaerolineae bacterium]|nr:hypothetical protein [Anaerolineae bacterium]MBL8104012.1 hypothetical protein [Anaerolineales bacterium]MCC7190777.1 hypothetical protein [Anaerolineales bacterium]